MSDTGMTYPRQDSSMSRATKRVEFVDIAKGIGMLLVVWYHIGFSPGEFLNAFFMPLFFLCSGIFFKTEVDRRTFFSKKFRQLIGPLLVGVVLGVVVEIFVNRLHSYHESIESGFYNFWLVGNVPLWFLLSLFWVMTLTYVVERFVKAGWLKISLYGLLFFIGYLFARFGIKNSLFIGQGLLVMPFFILGYKYKDFWVGKKWHSWIMLAIYVALSCVLLYFKTELLNVHQMYINDYYFPSMIIALCLVMMTFELALLLEGTKLGGFLAWIGGLTIFVVMLHDLFVPKIQSALPFISVRVSSLTMYPVAFVSAVVLTLVCIYFGRLLKRILPNFFP